MKLRRDFMGPACPAGYEPAGPWRNGRADCVGTGWQLETGEVVETVQPMFDWTEWRLAAGLSVFVRPVRPVRAVGSRQGRGWPPARPSAR